MLAALPTQPSFGLDPIVPLFPSLFSVTSAPSALRSPRSPIAEFHPVAQQPNHFPLFPHPVNIAHAGKPANPSSSIVYFTTSRYPGGGVSTHSLTRRFRSMPRPTPASALSITPLNATLTRNLVNTHSKALAAKLSPLDATLTRIQGGLAQPRALALLATHYSPPTTHSPNQSATLSLRGTHDPR